MKKEAQEAKKKIRRKKLTTEKASFYKDLVFPATLTILITSCLMFLIVLMSVSRTLGPMDRQYVAQFSGMFGVAFGSCCVYWFKDNVKKKDENYYKSLIFPAILTVVITICLMFLIVLMTGSHSLQAVDRQYIAQFSGVFGVAFGSCCVYWFKDKRKKK